MDAPRTSAAWSVEERQVYLAWRGRKVARFDGGTDFGGGSDPADTGSVALGDVDGDGDLDVLAANINGWKRIYLNNGSGVFPASGRAVGSEIESTYALVPGDLDGDGDLDLVAGNSGQVNRLYMTESHVTHQGVAVSLQVNGGEGIVAARLTAAGTVSTPATRNTSIDYLLSNDGGATWHRVSNGTAFTFPSVGTDLRWKAEMRSLSPVRTPWISQVLVEDANTPPTVSDVPDRTIDEDGTTGALAFTVGDAQTAPENLGVTASSDDQTLLPDADIVLGGSAASRTVAATPAPDRHGSATVTLTVSDGLLSTVETFLLTVLPVNDPPAAVSGGPYYRAPGEGLLLDGSGSYDPDAADAITLWEWDLDNDALYDDASGETVSLTWPEVEATICGGSCVLNTPYPVGLRVTDSNGASAVDATTVTVLVAELTAAMTADPNPATCNGPVSFDGSSSSQTHPDLSVVGWEWDFDYDGATFNVDDTGVTVTHAYDRYGTYTAALRVTDDAVPPATDIATLAVEVSVGGHGPYSNAGGPYLVRMGRDLVLDGTGTWDPDAGCGDYVAVYDCDLNYTGKGYVFDTTGVKPLVDWATVEALACGGTCTPGQTSTIALRATDSLGTSFNTAFGSLTILDGVTSDLVVDFGASGVWVNCDDGPAAWGMIHASSPELVATGDLDGGADEVILDFGAGAGIWADYNDDPASWGLIHSSSCEAMVTGNVNGN